MKRLTICMVLVGIAGCRPESPREIGDVNKRPDLGQIIDEPSEVSEEKDANPGKTEAELDKAIAAYSEAIRLDPAHAVAYYNRGLAYKSLGDKVKAEADLARGRELGFED